MNTTILFETHYGNTAFVAHVMAQMLAREGSVHLDRMDHATEAHVAQSDLLLLGGPAPDLNGADDFLPVIGRFLCVVLDRVAIAVFDTQPRYLQAWAESTASLLARAVSTAGGVLILPPESFSLLCREGPLEAGELARAAQWACEACDRRS
jgi:flavodoxin